MNTCKDSERYKDKQGSERKAARVDQDKCAMATERQHLDLVDENMIAA